MALVRVRFLQWLEVNRSVKKSGGPNQWPSALQTIPRAVLLFFRAEPVLSSLQAAITVVRAVLPLLENSLATHFRLLKYLTALMSERQAANEVRLFGLSDYFVPRFREVNNHRLRREQAFTRRSTLWRAGLGVVSDVAVAGVWVFIVLRALARTISVGDVQLTC